MFFLVPFFSPERTRKVIMIIIHITTCVEAVKPRQIINYDTGIVLIDLHQLNVETTSDNTNQRHWIRGNLMSTKNRRRTTAQHHFPNQMIEQINIALEQKGPKFLQLGRGTCRRRLTSRKESATSIKSDEEWTSRVLPSEQDDIVNSLNYEGIAVIELQFYHFLTVTDCVFGSVRTKIWMISSYGDQSTTGIILHIIIVLHQRCLNCSECFRNTYVLYMQLQHQGNS